MFALSAQPSLVLKKNIFMRIYRLTSITIIIIVMPHRNWAFGLTANETFPEVSIVHGAISNGIQIVYQTLGSSVVPYEPDESDLLLEGGGKKKFWREKYHK